MNSLHPVVLRCRQQNKPFSRKFSFYTFMKDNVSPPLPDTPTEMVMISLWDGCDFPPMVIFLQSPKLPVGYWWFPTAMVMNSHGDGGDFSPKVIFLLRFPILPPRSYSHEPSWSKRSHDQRLPYTRGGARLQGSNQENNLTDVGDWRWKQIIGRLMDLGDIDQEKETTRPAKGEDENITHQVKFRCILYAMFLKVFPL